MSMQSVLNAPERVQQTYKPCDVGLKLQESRELEARSQQPTTLSDRELTIPTTRPTVSSQRLRCAMKFQNMKTHQESRAGDMCDLSSRPYGEHRRLKE